METRKLIRSGPSSLLISLPGGWLRSNNLKKGSLVYLELSQNAIEVSARSPQPSFKKDFLIVSEDKPYIVKEHLIHCFLHNYPGVIIKVRDGSALRTMTDLIKSIPGFTFDFAGGNLTVHNRFDLDNIDISDELRDLFKMNRYILESLSQGDLNRNPEMIILLKSLREKSFIAECCINRILEAPLANNSKSISLAQMTYYKIILHELPYLIQSEIELTRFFGDGSNPDLYRQMISVILENADIKKSSLSEIIAIRRQIDAIEDKMSGLKNIGDLKLLHCINKMLTSLLKMKMSL